MEPIFFESPAAWRAWLEEHHDSESEVLVGYYKKHTGKQGMTWSQAVDEALCFGWIDGVVGRIDDERHQQRFTPRKARSTWSAVNIRKFEALSAEGRMTDAGRRAHEARTEENSRIYAFEQENVELPAEYEARLRSNAEAWAYWESRPKGYRRIATWWVVSAKREETRERRIATLVEDCAAGRLIKSQRRRDRTS
jgi:uncharacterized protein YdeI (YjbR/CyaY-like superfamily)